MKLQDLKLQGLHGLLETFGAFWEERDIRERKALILAAGLILLTLLYLLFINPPLTGRIQLDKNLPVLRQQAAELQAMAGEAAQLGQQAAPPSQPLSKELVDAALTRHGLKAKNVVVTGEMLKVEFTGASFAALMNWLDEMQRIARAAVVESAVDVQPALDTVNATLTLRQQASER